MKCLHCLVEFHDNNRGRYIGQDADGYWDLIIYTCPVCERMNIYLKNYVVYRDPNNEGNSEQELSVIAVHPLYSSRPPCPIEVPEDIAEDYTEACRVLPFSTKASAALSRRCLQNILRGAAKIKPGNLADEIQAVIDSERLPSYLVEGIDAIRNIGNFAAHPMKSKTSGEILPVEPGEAEWTLDVLEQLFDFYYVQPKVIEKKREQLNVKLKEAGKPPMK